MKKIIKISALLLSLALALGVFVACDDKDVTKDEISNDVLPEFGSNIGERAPYFYLEVINSDKKVNIKDFLGRAVVINFWGIWCGPCKSELPAFNRLASDYKDDVVIIAVHSVANKHDAPEYIAANYPNSDMVFAYDVPIDEYTDMYFDALGGTSYYPHTVVLDKNGVITFMNDGAMSYESLKSEVDKALAK